MASILSGLATTAGLGLASSVGGFLAKEKNVLVRLDDPSNPLFLTDQELKKEVCGKQKEPKEPTKKTKEKKEPALTKKELSKLLKEIEGDKKKSNLEKILERL